MCQVFYACMTLLEVWNALHMRPLLQQLRHAISLNTVLKAVWAAASRSVRLYSFIL